MILRIEHRTIFEYDAPIYETATEVRLQPHTGPNAGQRCNSFTLEVDPPAPIFEYTDFYGNRVHHFNLLRSHSRVSILGTSVVETGTGRKGGGENEEILQMDCSAESRYVHLDAAVRDFVRDLPAEEDPEALAAVLCRKINESFTYEPGATDVHSTSSVVMALGRGVCQDFAHVMLAGCRTLGLAARYVSGYLFGGSTPEGHDEASHAWCEVWCGPEKGWVGMDPTHSTIMADERYIRIGSGRDYGDVPPVRGTWKGSATETLSVSVRVTDLG